MDRLSPQHKALIEKVTGLFRDNMPFNQLLGMTIREDNGELILEVPWQPQLTGNPMQKILHGGVTATLLDTIGGLVAITEAIKLTPEAELPRLSEQLSQMGTIDMRVDYLRPGRGERFIATAKVIRKGQRVAVCRMELHNESHDHIAFGTGTYMLG